ncbi:uncharacterized protein YmfQ (DUF2313 family) [Angulomicrobium tetraedrale]|uniref:Uncharacterized protein YmfQ (DUF2313 family) n=1 Tax=Ancylobacter tetraedralis TaxID=217068 RepID=A0A839Z9U7_9HYPH|nr:putative phage tail protein [Ancylobacter tetraedralis]MBB3771510.1 uncharacterized protein YmfQ (DUF2313 family) [Ancylobacter tetraedralis]
MRDPGLNTWTYYAPVTAGGDVPPPMPGDALSDPSVEGLLSAGLACWPVGAAWGTPDGMAAGDDTGLARFTRAVLAPFVDLYARAWRLVVESTAGTMGDSLPEWEADHGLPDACTSVDQSTAGRRQAVQARVRGTGVITPLDFVRLAHDRGFEIAIEEPALFECGFSECGGEHTLGDAREEAYWIVHVSNIAVDYFVVGESECGFDPLFATSGLDRLQCLFRGLYPGWTQPVYEIDEELPPFAHDWLTGLDSGGERFFPRALLDGGSSARLSGIL